MKTHKIESIEDILRASDTDPRHLTGEIIGSMTTAVHPRVYDVILKYIEKNHNDPHLFPSISILEEELMTRTKRLLRIPQDMRGVLTSGGTESNLLAVYSAKRTYGSRTVISLESAHHSVDKAAILLDMNKITLPVDQDGYYNEEDLIRSISRNPNSVLVLTLGTTEIGRADSVKAVLEHASKYNVHVHIDGALGGFTYPFTHPENFKDIIELIEMGVASFSVDYHKFLGAPSPSSVIFLKEEMQHAIKWKSMYMPSGSQVGLLGTRPGYMSAAALAALILRERELPDLARESLSLALWTKESLERSYDKVRIPRPDTPILCVGLEDPETAKMAWSYLWGKGIKAYFCSKPPGLRLVFMPHVKKRHIDRFISHLLGFLKAERRITSM